MQVTVLGRVDPLPIQAFSAKEEEVTSWQNNSSVSNKLWLLTDVKKTPVLY